MTRAVRPRPRQRARVGPGTPLAAQNGTLPGENRAPETHHPRPQRAFHPFGSAHGRSGSEDCATWPLPARGAPPPVAQVCADIWGTGLPVGGRARCLSASDNSGRTGRGSCRDAGGRSGDRPRRGTCGRCVRGCCGGRARLW